jgi:hypothetical protein
MKGVNWWGAHCGGRGHGHRMGAIGHLRASWTRSRHFLLLISRVARCQGQYEGQSAVGRPRRWFVDGGSKPSGGLWRGRRGRRGTAAGGGGAGWWPRSIGWTRRLLLKRPTGVGSGVSGGGGEGGEDGGGGGGGGGWQQHMRTRMYCCLSHAVRSA